MSGEPMVISTIKRQNFIVKNAHPTKVALVNTVVELLENYRADEITSEQVLELSSISKGSLYHHFADFSALIDTARVIRYARWVDRSIELLTTVATTTKTREEFFAGLSEVTKLTQSPASRSSRFERARILGLAEGNPRLMHDLGEEQQRLTDSITDLVREAQERGYVRLDLDVASIAVLIQAYTLGKIVDDVTADHVDPDRWLDLLGQVIEKGLGA